MILVMSECRVSWRKLSTASDSPNMLYVDELFMDESSEEDTTSSVSDAGSTKVLRCESGRNACSVVVKDMMKG